MNFFSPTDHASAPSYPRDDWSASIPPPRPVRRDVVLGPSSNFWSSSSSASSLFQLPLEVLEYIVSCLPQGQDQSSFASANSDCRLLVRPYQFESLKVNVQESGHNTAEYAINQARLWTLIQESLHGVLRPSEVPLGLFIRTLRVVECTDTSFAQKCQLPDAVFTLLSGLVNLHSFSHTHNGNMRRILSAQYIASLRSTKIKHLQLEGFVTETNDLEAFYPMMGKSWDLHTLVLSQISNALSVRRKFTPATLITRLCSKTVRYLTLDHAGSTDFMFDGSLEFPALEALRLESLIAPFIFPGQVRMNEHPLQAPRLQELSITGVPLTDHTLPVVPTLRKVHISLPPMPHSCDLQQLCWSKQQLHDLSLVINDPSRAPPALSTAALADSLRSLGRLKSLKIRSFLPGVDIMGHDVLEAIASIITLENLELFPAGSRIGDPVTLHELLIRTPNALKSLRRLALHDTGFESIVDIVTFKFGTLTDSPMNVDLDPILDLINLYGILHDAEEYAARLPLLEWIFLGGCPMTIDTNRRAHMLIP